METCVSVFLKRHLKAALKSRGGVGTIQKWHDRKTKSICSQNPVLKCDDCDFGNVRKSARWKLSMVESDIDVSNTSTKTTKSTACHTATETSKLTASHTATQTSKSTASHTATKTSKSTASHTATKVATAVDGPFN